MRHVIQNMVAAFMLTVAVGGVFFLESFTGPREEQTADRELIDSLRAEVTEARGALYHEILTDRVEAYMEENTPGSPRVSADVIVNKCLQYDIDIPFVLAQAQLESHFGTRGVATRSNSVFNVGAYDDGRVLYTYDHPDESVEPYLVLLKTEYLVRGKTIHDLLRREFVNYAGYRYASNPSYEAELRRLSAEIRRETHIPELQAATTEHGFDPWESEVHFADAE